MYGLKLPTDPRWADLASISIEDLLTDHAYCEQKAASNGISIIQNFPELEELVEEVMPLVTEEWGHFKMVVDHIKKRNLKLGKKRKDVYVNELRKFNIKGGNRETLLLETLLTSAMIEARSCERFRILSIGLKDKELQQFYKNLMISEAGHYRMFLDLAIKYIGKEKALKRWDEFLIAEAEIMKKMELRGDRIH